MLGYSHPGNLPLEHLEDALEIACFNTGAACFPFTEKSTGFQRLAALRYFRNTPPPMTSESRKAFRLVISETLPALSLFVKTTMQVKRLTRIHTVWLEEFER